MEQQGAEHAGLVQGAGAAVAGLATAPWPVRGSKVTLGLYLCERIFKQLSKPSAFGFLLTITMEKDFFKCFFPTEQLFLHSGFQTNGTFCTDAHFAFQF